VTSIDKKPPLVLVVEDDRDLRRSLVAFLNDNGYQVALAENGSEGVQQFEKLAPQIVLTDLKMPLMDGHQLIAQIAGCNPDVPIIAISGTGVVLEAVSAIRLGAWELLTKPLEFDELERAISAALNRAARLKEERQLRKQLVALTEEQSYRLQQLEERLDPLTGLPTRAHLSELFYSTVIASDFNGSLSFLLLEPQEIKKINNTYGFECGDQILQQIVVRLQAALPDHLKLLRFSGSKFIVVSDCSSPPDKLFKKVLSCFATPYSACNAEFSLAVNAGLALFPVNGESVERLMQNADIALSEANRQGKGTFVYYTEELGQKQMRRLTTETRLRHALEHDEFLLHYQPLVACDNRHLVGFEALIRWKPAHEKQLIPPDNFIPILEETGMIVEVGRWVLHTACRQYMDWRRLGMPALRLSVNISACQFSSGNLVDDVRQALEENLMEPACLCLELTEGIVMANMQQTVEMLHQLHQLGVVLSLDDFGTGFSSLSYLRQMPLHELKIDRSFVEHLPNDANSVAIVDSILGMASGLNLEVVAEGVENEEQAAFLKERSCTTLQGYFFSRPLGADDFFHLYHAKARPVTYQQNFCIDQHCTDMDP